MPFQKGHKLSVGNKGGGRKGYEFEAQQLKRMSKILNGMLALTEKMMKDKASPHEQIRYENLMRITLKIMDKLHANRQALEIEPGGELPFVIKIVKDDPKKPKPKKGENS